MEAALDSSTVAVRRKPRVTYVVFATVLAILVALCGSYFVARYQQEQKWRDTRRSVDLAGGDMFGRPRDRPFIQLKGDSITDATLMKFRHLVETDGLSLWQTRVTDSGLAAIANWNNLKHFGSQSDLLTDAAMTHLQGHAQLERLELIGAQITDATLRKLAAFKRLKILDLSCCTNLTETGVKKLQAALPNCEIIWTTDPYVPVREPE